MTDRADPNREDLAIEQALSRVMATGTEPRLVRGGESADAALVREYTELLGLLPYELPAAPLPLRVRDRLMRRVAGAPAAVARSAGAPGTVTPSSQDLDDLTLHSPGDLPEALDATLRRDPPAGVVPSPPPASWVSSWGGLAMAASLAFCLLGLGLLSALAWQQSQRIGRLQGQLAASAVDPGEIVHMREELRTTRDRLDMVTTVARHAYPLRVATTGLASRPEGIVYVCGQHQQWYLSLRGLEPPGDGEEYRLWFMTDGGKIDGGPLDVRPDAHAEKEALSMPAGTHGFAVTLEKQGPRDEPESLTILLGERAVNL